MNLLKTKLLKHWPLIFIICLVAIFFYPVWLRGQVPIPADITVGVYYPWLDYKWGNIVGVAVKNPLMSDIPSLIYPWRELAVNLLKQGQWPLWNQYSFSGYPLLGNWQSAPFSPANIFNLAADFPWGWTLGVIFQPLLALAFMYWWLRSQKLNPLAGLLGGWLYAFSGFQITWMEYNTHQWTTVWLPLILLSIDKILAGKFNWGLILSLVIGLLILSGYPILLIYEAMIVSIYLCSQIITKRLIIPQGIVLIFSVTLGLGLAAIQWLPGWETIQNSIHQIDTSTLDAGNQGFLPLQNLITFLAPDFFGHPATYNYWGIGYYDNWASYISIGALLLVCLIWVSGRAYLWLAITTLGFILATNNPLAVLIRNLLPGLENSIPTRSLFLVDTAIALSAAQGLDYLLVIKKNSTSKLTTFLVIIFWFGVLGLIWLNTTSKNFLQIPYLSEHQAIATRNLLLPSLLLLVSGITFIISNLVSLKYRRWLLTLLVLIIMADLFRYAWKYLPFSPPRYIFPNTRITDWLKEQKNSQPPFRVEFGEVIPQNMWTPYRLESPGGYDALLPLRNAQFLEAIQSGKFSNSVSRFPKIENLDSRLWELTNTKYVLALKYNDKWERSPTGSQLKEIYRKNYLKPVFEHGTVIILENQRYLPRAFVVPSAEIIKDDSQLIDHLVDRQTDFRTTVYLDQDYPLLPKTDTLPESRIDWEKSSSQTKKLKVTTTQSGYLVLLESYHPGWLGTIITTTKVTHPQPLRADFNYMAIPIEQGTNQVTLTFYPNSFKWGLWASIVCLLIWCALTTSFLAQKILSKK